ncbi:MAG: type VI secretion system tip protein VgrG [Xanthomonadaceae bacterium]|jgi:type VI secretion system secreted protein VgrG|nr:type VI secretion system tip protein VgrG [Xanthomonadaceae bacterium]
MADSALPLQVTTSLLGQEDRLLRLRFPHNDGPEAHLVPECLQAEEGLSQDFCFTATLLSNNAAIPAKELIGKMACIELVRKDRSFRYFNGYIFEFRRIKTDGGLAFYEMKLGPWLAFLKFRTDNYLFHDKTISDQTADIFKDYEQCDYKIEITGDDPSFTMAVQWDESDYNYVHRRWEAIGWHYHYLHRADGHQLVLSDDSPLLKEIDGDFVVRYHERSDIEDSDAIHQWSPHRRLTSTQYTAATFDFKIPKPQRLDVPTINEQGKVPALEIYEDTGAYGFRGFFGGNKFTQRRMEEIEARAKQFDGQGDCARIQPGRWFRLADHYEHEYDSIDDREFLVVAATHTANNNFLQDGKPAIYSNSFSCIRKKIPWRPGRGMNSYEPKVQGLLTAIVVGPPGEEIYCDEFGRIRVQFHFDREGRYDQRSSCWVRVGSSWSGSQFGFMSIPRIGQEVVVQFLGGNPDMPLVTGLVYNSDNMPPWSLPFNKTQTGFMSRSIGGGIDNYNTMRFEDLAGLEQLYMQAERNMDTLVKRDQSLDVGNDRSKTIGNNDSSKIGFDRLANIGQNDTSSIGSNMARSVGQDMASTIGGNLTSSVGQNASSSIGQSMSESIGQSMSQDIGQNAAQSVGQNMSQSVGQDMSTSVNGNNSLSVGQDLSQSVQGNSSRSTQQSDSVSVQQDRSVSVQGNLSQSVGQSKSEQINQNNQIQVGQKFSISANDEFSVTVGQASLQLKSDGSISINGQKLDFSASESVKIQAPQIDLN